ncbi:MAG: hypothetical protein QM774_09445 [Gordonia sp. (in: high G+C Gram-positive bacteria)]|uniref:LVIVD repeat-containing protein n=1 Tax=Gordonia sp. (in: high G+C Gram-positive bacteria) TaxID=84139 RepID=UPI0039E3C221
MTAGPAAAAPRLPIAKADCGPGSSPETGMQGDVPARDRDSGRSTRGYNCNVKRLGQYQGHGGGITSTSYDHCGYMGSMFPGSMVGPDTGVAVVDASDPTHLRKTATLHDPALSGGTWESLKANRNSKLLVGMAVPLLTGAGLMGVYDVSDCAHPKLLNNPSNLLPITAHEGGFSPDGKTYWAMGTAPGVISAVSLDDPAHPRVLTNNLTALEDHGIGVSADGNTLYLSHNFGGISVWDVSSIQKRLPNPHMRKLSEINWTSGAFTQHSIPVSYGKNHYLFTALEGGSGGVKVVDVNNPYKPKVINELKLEINLPQNEDAKLASSMGGSLFAYESHYCAADRPDNPTALACGWISSGIRVFDVRDPMHVKEIAYYNPPAQTNKHLDLWNSPHTLASFTGIPFLSAPGIVQSLAQGDFDPAQAISQRSGRMFADLSSDWCFAPPEWRGDKLYVGCSDNGYQVLQLTNDVYTPPADQQSHVGS